MFLEHDVFICHLSQPHCWWRPIRKTWLKPQRWCVCCSSTKSPQRTCGAYMNVSPSTEYSLKQRNSATASIRVEILLLRCLFIVNTVISKLLWYLRERFRTCCYGKICCSGLTLKKKNKWNPVTFIHRKTSFYKWIKLFLCAVVSFWHRHTQKMRESANPTIKSLKSN